jgi:hypothetical protein
VGDAIAPECAERPQVGSELASPCQGRSAVGALEHEWLDGVRHRPAHHAEVDPSRARKSTTSTVVATPHFTGV